MEYISGKDVKKQMTGNYASSVILAALILGLLGFCIIFCGTQLAWKNIVTIILMVVGAAAAMWLIVSVILLLRAGSNPALKRYGSAEMIAYRINEGMKDPRYLYRYVAPATGHLLIADTFIVPTYYYMNFLELAEIQSIQFSYTPTVRPIVRVGSDVVASLAATAIAGGAMKMISPADNNKLDIMTIKDIRGKNHTYSVRRGDIMDIARTLAELVPDVQITL